MDIIIKKVLPTDAQALLDIYTPYVRETAVTFEKEVPSLDEFRFRIANTVTKYPYFVAHVEGKIAGYCYAGPLKNRAAYDWSVETSIYVDRRFHHMGIGRQLYKMLEDTLKKQNFVNMFACVARPETENAYLNFDSTLFHKAMGFEEIGLFRNCGYKFSQWFSMMWLSKNIGEYHDNQPAIIPFSKLDI